MHMITKGRRKMPYMKVISHYLSLILFQYHFPSLYPISLPLSSLCVNIFPYIYFVNYFFCSLINDCLSRVIYLLYGYTYIVRDDPCSILQVPGRREMSISRPRSTTGKIFILAELSLGRSFLKQVWTKIQ